VWPRHLGAWRALGGGIACMGRLDCCTAEIRVECSVFRRARSLPLSREVAVELRGVVAEFFSS
jgi:hypothetical protein